MAEQFAHFRALAPFGWTVDGKMACYLAHVHSVRTVIAAPNGGTILRIFVHTIVAPFL